MAETERNLENTPSWAIAAVVLIFVSLGLVVVFVIDQIEERLKRARKAALVHTVQKMKEELMLLGFISLLLTVLGTDVRKICISDRVMDRWNLCRPLTERTKTETPSGTESSTEGHRRRLLALNSWPMNAWAEEPVFRGRMLEEEGRGHCKEGKSPLLSSEGLEMMHTFIFILGVVHLFYTLLIILLAILKVKTWRAWEKEAQESSRHHETKATKAPRLPTPALGKISFVKRHTARAWHRNSVTVWVVCFLRQFGRGVTRSDYLSLRHGFITAHKLSPNFDFHRYLLRSLDDEFPYVVGISPYHWMWAVIILAFNVHGVNLFFFATLTTSLLLLAIGTKLQYVIAALARDESLRPRDDLFWFNRPRLVLSCLRFILFQNAFAMTVVGGVMWVFGTHSCLLGRRDLFFVRVSLGLIGHVLCSYSTLPVYAIVTQMGSSYKRAIFTDDTRDQLQRWRRNAKKRVRQGTTRSEGFFNEDETVAKRSNSQGKLSSGSLSDDSRTCDNSESSRYGENTPKGMMQIPKSSRDGAIKFSRCVSEPTFRPRPRSRLSLPRNALSLESVSFRHKQNSEVEIRIVRTSSD